MDVGPTWATQGLAKGPCCSGVVGFAGVDQGAHTMSPLSPVRGEGTGVRGAAARIWGIFQTC
jgi:hypothetical protein